MKSRIRKGDLVEVITGADKGKRGRVIAVDPERGKLRVEKVRMQKRHFKPGRRGARVLRGSGGRRQARQHEGGEESAQGGRPWGGIRTGKRSRRAARPTVEGPGDAHPGPGGYRSGVRRCRSPTGPAREATAGDST